MDSKNAKATRSALQRAESKAVESKRKKGGPRAKKISRVLAEKEPKVNENTKVAMFIRGHKTGQAVNQFLNEMYLLKKPDGIKMNKKNLIRPFEDPSSIEFFSSKNDASLFMLGSHTKKRPMNVVLGRLFDHSVLDLLEVGIENFKSLFEFPMDKQGVGTKPCIVFQGDEWQTQEEFKKLSNLLLDFFRGDEVTQVNLQSLEHVIICSVAAGRVYFRVYRIRLKKSGLKQPRIELEEIGPSFDMVLRRTKFASEELWKEATKMPPPPGGKKVKNVSKGTFAVEGQVHVSQQDLATLNQKKQKALRPAKRRSDSAEGDAALASNKRKTKKQRKQ